MKLAMTAAAMMMTVSGTELKYVVPVSVSAGAEGSASMVIMAKHQVSKMMATAGVRIEWLSEIARPRPGVIRITFANQATSAKSATTMAQAKLFEGTNITIFINRVREKTSRDTAWRVLSHVMAHEITHMLQGIDVHAETGIMKAAWGTSDFASMAYQPLTFEPWDIILMHQGLEKRRAANTVLASAR